MLQPLYREAGGFSPSDESSSSLTNNGITISGINDLLIAVDGKDYKIQG